MEPTTTTTEQRGPTDFETLTGKSLVNARKLDGTPITLTIRQLPIREFPRLLELQGKEEELIELYTGLPEGSAAELDTESQLAVLDAGDRINADFFARWVRRRMRASELLRAPESSPSPIQLQKRPLPQG